MKTKTKTKTNHRDTENTEGTQRGNILLQVFSPLRGLCASAALWFVFFFLTTSMAHGADDPLSEAAIERRIEQHRTALVTLTVTDSSGRPLAGRQVTIRQTRHKFLFGSNAYALRPDETDTLQQQYQQRFADLLNFATIGFYWGSLERSEGDLSAAALRRAQAQWCADHGIRTKGHPLVWHEVPPRWLGDHPVDKALELQLGRVTRDVTAFRGAIDTWDVINETVVMPKHDGPVADLARHMGVDKLIAASFARARAANPAATLLINDYLLGVEYEKIIADALAAGVTIDAIGLQSHMHNGAWPPAKAWEICERFARFGKPLHFTETTIISGEQRKNINNHGPNPGWDSTPEGEARQARDVERFYTILFSHPAVEAITWWDLSDRHAWRQAPAGLLRKDMSPKPAYETLMKLVKGKWWTGEVKATTDAQGRATFRGFLGDYEIEAAGGKGRFELNAPGEAKAAARIE